MEGAGGAAGREVRARVGWAAARLVRGAAAGLPAPGPAACPPPPPPRPRLDEARRDALHALEAAVGHAAHVQVREHGRGGDAAGGLELPAALHHLGGGAHLGGARGVGGGRRRRRRAARGRAGVAGGGRPRGHAAAGGRHTRGAREQVLEGAGAQGAEGRGVQARGRARGARAQHLQRRHPRARAAGGAGGAGGGAEGRAGLLRAGSALAPAAAEPRALRPGVRGGELSERRGGARARCRSRASGAAAARDRGARRRPPAPPPLQAVAVAAPHAPRGRRGDQVPVARWGAARFRGCARQATRLTPRATSRGFRRSVRAPGGGQEGLWRPRGRGGIPRAWRTSLPVLFRV